MSRRQEAEWKRQQEKEMRAAQRQSVSHELQKQQQRAMSMRSTRSSPSRSQGSESFGMQGPMPGYDQYGNRIRQQGTPPMMRQPSHRQSYHSGGGNSVQGGEQQYGQQQQQQQPQQHQQQAPQQQHTQEKKGWLQSVFSGGPFRSSQQPAPPVLIQGTWSNGEEPPGGAPAHGGPHPRSSSGTGSVPVGGPDTSQRLSMGGSGEVIPASAFPPQRPQQQQQQPQQRQAAPNMASDPSASSSAQVRDLQHRISVLESQLQEVDVLKRQAISEQRTTNEWREKWNFQNFKLNLMVDMLVLRVLEVDGDGGRVVSGNSGNEATFGGKGGPVILKRGGEMKVEDF